MNKKIKCPFCFEKFSLEIYPEDGNHQEIIYDCEVCCHPIEINVLWDEFEKRMNVEVKKSTGFDG